MKNEMYFVHDFERNETLAIGGYEDYLLYFCEKLKPAGYGTRWLFADCTKGNQEYHYRLVREKRGCV